jgi:hypothetical protein
MSLIKAGYQIFIDINHSPITCRLRTQNVWEKCMRDQMYGTFHNFLVFSTTDGVNQMSLAEWIYRGIEKRLIFNTLNTDPLLQNQDIGLRTP